MNEELEKVFYDNCFVDAVHSWQPPFMTKEQFVSVVSKLLAENAVTEFERGIVSAENAITSIKNVAIKDLEKLLAEKDEEIKMWKVQNGDLLFRVANLQKTLDKIYEHSTEHCQYDILNFIQTTEE